MLADGKGGSIINISSIMGMGGGCDHPVAYQASKGAVNILTKNLACSWADRGVRVNAILPGYFPSEMTDPFFEVDGYLDYVNAATAFGVPSRIILIKHLLPNVMHLVLISIVLDFSGLVLAEAVLSYVGVGVDPTMNSWGNMINSARLEMAREPVVWWSLLSAFLFMFVLVLAANLFSDAVRDAFDPRTRER